ncbi:hypothetical protein COI59_23690 [Bacillus toyonensis]|nr:hypothetical protein COI59_23690 [Bacillus toyonensis]
MIAHVRGKQDLWYEQLTILLFSTYSTLKCVLFIMLNIFHNSTCRRETSFTVLKRECNHS